MSLGKMSEQMKKTNALQYIWVTHTNRMPTLPPERPVKGFYSGSREHLSRKRHV